MNHQENHSHNKSERPKNTGSLAIGIVIVTLVAVFFFSAVAGVLVFFHANRDRFMRPEATPPQETSPSVTEQDPKESAPGTNTGEHLDPSFSWTDLARPAPEPGKEYLTIPEIVDKVKPAVVAIYTNVVISDQFGGLEQNTVSGSGFIISEDGYVVTNAHVIENARSIHVSLEDERSFEATLLGSDAYGDVAVLKIEGDDLPTAVLGDSSKLLIGELAIAIGNPTGRLSGTVTSGIISALDRELTQSPIALIQTDAALNPGNSGGALVNAYGEVIGINQLKILHASQGSVDQIQGISFAIPVNAAKPIIENIIRTGKHVWPMMGISVLTVEKDLATDQGLHYPGVVIVSLEPKGPGEQAGLKPGDVIVAMNGQKVETTKQLADLKNEHQAGDEVSLTIYRGTEKIEITMRLGASS